MQQRRVTPNSGCSAATPRPASSRAPTKAICAVTSTQQARAPMATAGRGRGSRAPRSGSAPCSAVEHSLRPAPHGGRSRRASRSSLRPNVNGWKKAIERERARSSGDVDGGGRGGASRHRASCGVEHVLDRRELYPRAALWLARGLLRRVDRLPPLVGHEIVPRRPGGPRLAAPASGSGRWPSWRSSSTCDGLLGVALVGADHAGAALDPADRVRPGRGPSASTTRPRSLGIVPCHSSKGRPRSARPCSRSSAAPSRTAPSLVSAVSRGRPSPPC